MPALRCPLAPAARPTPTPTTCAQGGLPPWDDADVPDGLMARVPEPGAVVSERSWPGLGATELTLSNGLRLCLKETDHLEDELMVTGFARGGLSQVGGLGAGWGRAGGGLGRAGVGCARVSVYVRRLGAVGWVFGGGWLAAPPLRSRTVALLPAARSCELEALLGAAPAAQVPEPEFADCSLANLVAGQLGPFGHKPHVVNELLAGGLRDQGLPLTRLPLSRPGARQACRLGRRRLGGRCAARRASAAKECPRPPAPRHIPA